MFEYVSVDYEDYSNKAIKFYVFLKNKNKLFQTYFYAPKSILQDNKVSIWIITKSVIKKFGYMYTIYFNNPVYDYLRQKLEWDKNEILEMANQIYFDLLDSKYKIHHNSKIEFLDFNKNILILKIDNNIYKISVVVIGGYNVKSSYFKCHIKKLSPTLDKSK